MSIEYRTLEELKSDIEVFVDGDWVESKDQDPNGSIRLIQLADIGDGKFLNRSARFLTKEKARELNCTYLRKDDVLVARMPDPLGRACLFPLEEKDRYVTVVDVCIIRPRPQTIDPKYLQYCINAPQVRQEISALQSGSTRKRISRGNLATIKLPIAKRAEQEKIVKKIEILFSEIDAGLEDLRNAKVNLDLYKQSVLNSAIQGKLVPQDPKDEPASKLLERIRAEKEKLIEAGKLKKEKPLAPISEEETFGSIPKTWEFVRLGTIADHCLGKMLDKAKNRGTSQPYLRNINVRWFEFDLNDLLQMKFESNERERFQILKNDLVICEGGEPGRCAVWKRDEPIYFQKALHRVRPFSGIKSDYLALCIYADARFGRLESYFTGTGIKHFVGERLHTYVLPLPPIEEQDRISKAVNRIFSEISSHESDIAQQIQKLSLLKQSILKTAFEGRLI